MRISHLLPVLVCFLILCLCGCSGQQPPVSRATPGAGEGTAIASEPGRAYLNYDQLLGRAKSLDEIMPHLAAGARDKVNQVNDKSQILPLLQDTRAKGLSFISEEVSADKAIVTFEASDKSIGKITMVKEDGSWKLLEEEWITPEAPAPTATPK